jgi:hypothetical protein
MARWPLAGATALASGPRATESRRFSRSSSSLSLPLLLPLPLL